MLARLVLLAGVLAGCGVAALLVYMLARSLTVLLRHDFTRGGLSMRDTEKLEGTL